jgi:nitroimidazol reductase NimA-like FMN-containing flavoprotein (pyridoxamine 5'-phosphate oxidase superfamily)
MALAILSDMECTRRLREGKLGRLALVDRQSRPLIFPVNYFFDEGMIAFRTAPGSKLDLAPGAAVCFEIDSWDEARGEGWSVVAKGIAHDFTQPRSGAIARIHYWPVEPAAPGPRHHWIGILVTEITGRHFGPAAEATPE